MSAIVASKRGLSTGTTFDPPLFSLDKPFKRNSKGEEYSRLCKTNLLSQFVQYRVREGSRAHISPANKARAKLRELRRHIYFRLILLMRQQRFSLNLNLQISYWIKKKIPHIWGRDKAVLLLLGRWHGILCIWSCSAVHVSALASRPAAASSDE
jgi:hypothetical protein